MLKLIVYVFRILGKIIFKHSQNYTAPTHVEFKFFYKYDERGIFYSLLKL